MDPAGTHDDGFGAGRVLAGCLAGAIDGLRVPGVIGPVATTAGAIEDEIGGDLDEAFARAGQRPGESAGCAGVDGVGKVGFALGAVDRSVCRRVQHEIGLFGIDYARDGLGIGEVQRSAIERDAGPAFGTGGEQGLAKLTIDASDQGFHAKAFTSARGTPTASLAESFGSIPSSGQSMPTAGSSQARLASCCGAYGAVHL